MKLGLIGNWGHHVYVLEETDLCPEIEIAGIAPGIPGEDISSLAKRYAATANIYNDHQKMFVSEKPDLVVISTRLDRIAELAIDAAEAGCHSICEKPLAIEHGSLQRLWEAVCRNQTQCIAMLPNRNHPVLAFARQTVNSNIIGNVKLLNARKSYKCSNERELWLGKRETYGGTLPWLGIHALDFINFVVDSPCKSVYAQHVNAAHPTHPECEDICTMNLTFEDKIMATVSIDYLRPESAESHGDDWLRIVGTKRIIEASMDCGNCSVIDAEGHRTISKFAQRKPYFIPFIQEFCKAGKSAPYEVTCRSFLLTQTALAARDSADMDKIIKNFDSPWLDRYKQLRGQS